MTKEVKKEKVAAVDKKAVEVPEKFKALVSEIEKMSVLELSELVKVLEEKFGVSAAAPLAGRYVDRAALSASLREAASANDRAVQVPLREILPAADPARFRAAVDAARAAVAPTTWSLTKPLTPPIRIPSKATWTCRRWSTIFRVSAPKTSRWE